MKNLEEQMNELWEKSRHTALSPYHMGLYGAGMLAQLAPARGEK
jgi:hypothetical protein